MENYMAKKKKSESKKTPQTTTKTQDKTVKK